MVLKNKFIELLASYTTDSNYIQELWIEVEKNYLKQDRHYHNLDHLEDVYYQLEPIKCQISNWNMVLFSIFYHDIIYNTLRSNNEEKSAELAEKRMTQISMAKGEIALCIQHILATKSHIVSSDNDTNYFTDADLSILGQSWSRYDRYANNIRKEYAIYPDVLYNSGRKKVLQHFIKMNRIYKTPFFYEKYEAQAKVNLQKELDILG